jgi:hypothetical protein
MKRFRWIVIGSYCVALAIVITFTVTGRLSRGQAAAYVLFGGLGCLAGVSLVQDRSEAQDIPGHLITSRLRHRGWSPFTH